MNQAPSSICCLFAVVDRGKGEAVSAELRRRRILTQLVLLGHGTASAEVMDLLGLDEPEKDVVLALLPGDAGEVLAALTDRLELYRPGRGIAFTIGLCSISALAHQRIAAAAAAETPFQKEERPMRSQHELIVVQVLACGLGHYQGVPCVQTAEDNIAATGDSSGVFLIIESKSPALVGVLIRVYGYPVGSIDGKVCVACYINRETAAGGLYCLFVDGQTYGAHIRRCVILAGSKCECGCGCNH